MNLSASFLNNFFKKIDFIKFFCCSRLECIKEKIPFEIILELRIIVKRERNKKSTIQKSPIRTFNHRSSYLIGKKGT